jgi:hypothetical protein
MLGMCHGVIGIIVKSKLLQKSTQCCLVCFLGAAFILAGRPMESWFPGPSCSVMLQMPVLKQ